MSLRNAQSKWLIGVLLFTQASFAQAGLITVLGGSASTSPADNDVIGSGITGTIGSNLLLAGPAQLTFTYLGKEAAWTNVFNAFGDAASGTFNTSSAVAGDTFSVTQAAAGLLSFSFTTLAGTVNNGANGLLPPDFFTQQLSGSSVIVALDDGGAGPDVDYDDLVLRIDAVGAPEPATFAVLLAGLVCLGVVRRRVHPTVR